jgi:uncharacterized protein
MNTLTGKIDALRARLAGWQKVAVAYSGGVDSALLAWAAHDVLGNNAQAVTVNSQLIAASEHAAALEFCDTWGICCHTLHLDVLANSSVQANTALRCYHCKRLILEQLLAYAAANNLGLLVEGSNASDNEADRPGARALRELGVPSPLREVGLHKDEIREAARQAGLRVWDKPSNPCLATRIPTGTKLDDASLCRIEQAEDILAKAGLRALRVRTQGNAATIHADTNGLAILANATHRQRILESLQALGFAQVDVAPEPLER